MDDTKNTSVVIKVKASHSFGYAKKVSAAVAWQLRENGYCRMRAIKRDAINAAIKSVAIVNQQVRAVGVTLSIDPCFEQAAEPGIAVVSLFVKESLSDIPSEIIEYRVSGKPQEDEKSIVGRLAGAIAIPVKEGKAIRMRCIGPEAVYRGILASTIAKGHIYPNGYEACIVPTWDTLTMEGNDRPISLIQIDFWGVRRS